jgi:hypothetical protein
MLSAYSSGDGGCWAGAEAGMEAAASSVGWLLEELFDQRAESFGCLFGTFLMSELPVLLFTADAAKEAAWVMLAFFKNNAFHSDKTST